MGSVFVCVELFLFLIVSLAFNSWDIPPDFNPNLKPQILKWLDGNSFDGEKKKTYD